MIDATEQARVIRENETSPRELVMQSIERINQLNPKLNAVVHERFEEALSEADNRDFTNLPFGGVPILLKGLSQSMAGMPDTSGSRLFAKTIAKQNNHLVQRLIDAGFIVLGQTNVPEFGFKNVTDSELYQDAHNFYDTKRTPGGSSGGSASAISSGIVSVAGASDGGGSIRIPASFSNLIGLKPSRGRIVVGPGGMRGWGGASVSFALTQSVRDTEALLYLLEGKQAEAPYTIQDLPEMREHSKIDFKNLRIGFTTESPVGSPVSTDAILAVKKAVDYFTQQGASVEESKPDYDGVALMHAYYMMNGAETSAMMANISAGLNRPLTPNDMETMTWAIYQYGNKLSAADYISAFNRWDQAATILTDYHQTYDIFLTPSTAEVAPLLTKEYQSKELLQNLKAMDQSTSVTTGRNFIYEMFEKSLAVTPYSQLANLTGQPAISLPIYQNNQGLPLGIQLMAQKGNEPLLLQIAARMEEDGLFISLQK